MEKFGSKALSSLEEDKSHMKDAQMRRTSCVYINPNKYTVILCRPHHSCSIVAIPMLQTK